MGILKGLKDSDNLSRGVLGVPLRCLDDRLNDVLSLLSSSVRAQLDGVFVGDLMGLKYCHETDDFLYFRYKVLEILGVGDGEVVVLALSVSNGVVTLLDSEDLDLLEILQCPFSPSKDFEGGVASAA